MIRRSAIELQAACLALQRALLEPRRRIAFGPRAGQKVLSLQTTPSQAEQPAQERCVNAQGFSLHAEVRCAINQRRKLEPLCRYITRPAIANERLTLNQI